MKKTTEPKRRLNFLSRKPLAAITLLTALALPMSSAKAQTTVNGTQNNLQTAISNTQVGGTVTIGTIKMLHNEDGIIIGGNSSNGVKSNLTIKGTT
ncbi:MAG: hypothetical protein LBE12_11725, partial [Planctomycetaceae bacterium]|nr:hypothetical protein [Planctomycetaceae bacterium]